MPSPGISSHARKALERAEKNFDRSVARLADFVEIPGVSFSGFDPKHLRRAAEFTAECFRKAGMETVRLLDIPGSPPFVYAERVESPALPTVILYAHYDVQPPMREDRWHSPPFAPAVRKARLFGRGAADDKAGIILHAAGIAAWMDGAGRLPVNVKVLIEGEEEAGSPGLNRFLKKYRRMLKADLMVCADLSNFEAGLPTITTSLRGLVALELEVLALKSPLHSGMWGGVVPDPILELSKILSGLETPSGKIAIPEFYRMARPPGRAELNAFNRLPSNSRRFARQAGMLCGEKGLCVPPSRLWRTLWRTPSLNVNSIESGGRRLAGNVVMDRAWCRMGIRTVPGMDSSEVLALLEKKIRSLASPRVRVVLKPDTMGDAWVADTRSPCFRVYEEALRMGYGKNPVYAGCGGSIPFAGTLSSILGEIPSLLIGVEDPGSNVHSENESVGLSDLLKAIRSQVLFFDLLSSGVSSRSRV